MALRFKYLHKVDGLENNNKLYVMQENTDGTFTVTFGREGATKPQTKVYPISQWDSIYNEKTSKKKGYTDITEYRSIVENTSDAIKSNGDSIISNDKDVVDIITALQNFASAKTSEVYRSESKGVTQKQIDDAQNFLDNLSHSFKNHFDTNEWSLNLFNAELTKLYTVIPRKMQKVADHLVSNDWTKEKIEELINTEQSNLDSMAGQVLQNTAVEFEEKEATENKNTLLDTLGLEIFLVSDKDELKFVKEKAQEHGKRILRVFKVINKETQEKFDKQLNKAKNKKTDILWHGSRSQNFWFILQQGLKIRPSGAIYTGSMFGNCLYFAIESDKSMGYTDNGRWVNGRANNKVYMGLFQVHLGEQLIKNKHDSSCYDLNYKTISKDGYDSVWAKKGVSLYRDELMVYTPEQVTIKYLVEFSA
jgi:poly [ADP-ribose] polymerase